MPAYLEEGTGDKAMGGGFPEENAFFWPIPRDVPFLRCDVCEAWIQAAWWAWAWKLRPGLLGTLPLAPVWLPPPPAPHCHFSLSLVLSEKRDMGQGLRCIRQTASILGMKWMKSCRIAKQSWLHHYQKCPEQTTGSGRLPSFLDGVCSLSLAFQRILSSFPGDFIIKWDKGRKSVIKY